MASDFSFMLTEDPKVYSFHNFLFYEKSFHLVNTGEQPVYLQIFFNNTLIGIGILFIHPYKIYSSYRISFGGFDFKSDLKPQQVTKALKEASLFIHKEFEKKVELTLYPEFYTNQGVVITNWLKKKTIILEEWNNHYLKISKEIDVEGLWSYSDIKKLRKCERAQFYSRKLEVDQLRDVYGTIEKGWQKKGFELSMDEEDLVPLFEHYPESYMSFATFDGMDIISGAILVKINPKILYVFYLGFDPEYEKYSPNRFLIKAIYDWAKLRGFEFLDFGTSINEGVATFKERIGCQSCKKIKVIL